MKRLLLIFVFLPLIIAQVSAQSKTVEGTVTDSRGLPLEGVSVTIKGATTGVTTNNKGRYTVTAEPNAVLTFSYTGLTAVNEIVGPRGVINVTLQDPNSLENVVVVGYGTQKKVNLSGAVAQVSR